MQLFSRRPRAGSVPPGNSRSLHFALVSVLLMLGLLTAGVLSYIAHTATQASSTGLTPFTGTVSPLIARSSLRGPANPNQSISLAIGLRPRNADALTRYAQDISNRTSVNYHRYLAPVQIAAVFGPAKQTYNALLQFLETSGFTITHEYSHHLLINFSGTIGQAEQVFHVTLNNYTGPDSRVFYANNTDPLVPSSLVGAIQSISGLNNATRLHHPQIARQRLSTSASEHNALACPPPGPGTPGNFSYLTPNQTAAAYNLNGLYSAGFHGEGQTVALFELATFQVSDLTNYASCFGHARTAIQTVVTGTGAVPTNSDVLEVELDAELVLSAAPQLGILRIYEAANDAADFNAEWARIIADAPPVVSTSWGECEQNVGQQQAQQENMFFQIASTEGESIFAASGDSGSSDCAFDQPPFQSNALNVDDPAAQPFVTGVGGTTLTSNTSGAYISESVWNNSIGASGGGLSQIWPISSWQTGPGVSNQFSNGHRETPDVSLNADPQNGYLVYCSSTAAHCTSTGAFYIVGGTSAAAPMWAAMMALTNEMSLKMGAFSLGFVNPLLYQTASFHDITTGNNDYKNLHGGLYPATSNYDLATGLGSYNAFALAQSLVSLAQSATGPRSSPANKTWYFAEGSVGGGFEEYLTIQNPNTTTAATVNVTYLFQSLSAVTKTHTIAASTRGTIYVNGDLGISSTSPQQAIAAIVQVSSGPAIVVERPMYFNFLGIRSGTDVVGATSPQTTYYFPRVDTRRSGRTYYTFITMLNPSTTQNATVTARFYTGTCGQNGQPACPIQMVTILPLHRGTIIPPTGLQMAVSVNSSLPVVVERPMYFSDNIPTAGGVTTGAASEVGATSPGNDWLFAEGYTGPNFQEYFILANFGTTATTATIKLEYTNGHTQAIPVNVPALGQLTFDVNQANAHPTGTCDVNPCQTTTSVSAELTSAGPVVADRLMYFHYGSSHITGGTETVGEAGPASHSVYAFAEGYTANTFQEYLTLQNPTNNSETVAVTLFADGYVFQQQVIAKAHSRQTVYINGLVVPIAQVYNNMGANSFAVSLSVQALGANSKIVAERPMYFNYKGIDQGGTDVLGYTGG
jgi:Pro-kumamolisin, activation domain